MNRAMVLLPLSLLLRADVCLGGLGFPGSLPATTEVSAKKQLTLHLDRAQPSQRFLVPVNTTPPSTSAHVDVVVTRTSRTIRLEIADASLASTEPDGWTPVSTGFVGSVLLNGTETQNVVLAVGIDPLDLEGDGEIDLVVDVDVVLASPADVDFDGASDGVVVDFGALEPLP